MPISRLNPPSQVSSNPTPPLLPQERLPLPLTGSQISPRTFLLTVVTLSLLASSAESAPIHTILDPDECNELEKETDVARRAMDEAAKSWAKNELEVQSDLHEFLSYQQKTLDEESTGLRCIGRVRQGEHGIKKGCEKSVALYQNRKGTAEATLIRGHHLRRRYEALTRAYEKELQRFCQRCNHRIVDCHIYPIRFL